jgi:hypothetical protein
MNHVKTVLAAAAILTTACSGAFAGDTLKASEIRNLLPGRFQVTVMGSINMTIALRSNGTVIGTTKNESDTGHWTLNGSRLCIGFDKWLGGQTRCSSLISQAGYYEGSGFTFRPI